MLKEASCQEIPQQRALDLAVPAGSAPSTALIRGRNLWSSPTGAELAPGEFGACSSPWVLQTGGWHRVHPTCTLCVSWKGAWGRGWGQPWVGGGLTSVPTGGVPWGPLVGRALGALTQLLWRPQTVCGSGQDAEGGCPQQLAGFVSFSLLVAPV